MAFEDLDSATRIEMMNEYDAEVNGGSPYTSKALSALGRSTFPELLRNAIRSGNEESLALSLLRPELWNPTETYLRAGIARERKVNISQAAQRLALTEFNTWYVRGFAGRLMKEGVTHCQAYRAAEPKWEPSDCSAHEGQVFLVEDIYRAHRARYWPVENANAVSIPFGPGCHHTIRRRSS
jgi:hypothetical protein